MRRAALTLTLIVVAMVAVGVAVVVPGAERSPARGGEGLLRESVDRARDAARRARNRAGDLVRRDSRPLPAAGCPPIVADCRAVRGRVVYVERVDPDGDGDLHVVVADGSVTGPGVTAVDVRRGLRPRRDPRIGDLASAAGPVQRGSYGQAQIHALEFHLRRR